MIMNDVLEKYLKKELKIQTKLVARKNFQDNRNPSFKRKQECKRNPNFNKNKMNNSFERTRPQKQDQRNGYNENNGGNHI